MSEVGTSLAVPFYHHPRLSHRATIPDSLCVYVRVTSSLNLESNVLCGIMWGEGTYDATGIKAIAEALKRTLRS